MVAVYQPLYMEIQIIMSIVTGSDQIRCVQLVAVKGAIKLEALGMIRRGRSATVMWKEHYGLKRSAKREEVIACINAELNDLHKRLGLPLVTKS